MFNRYWRSYPWYMQLFQFVILMLVMISFFVLALTPLVLNLFKVTAAQFTALSEASPRSVINAALWAQLLSALGVFLFPALLFAYFTHPKPFEYLGLRKPRSWQHVVLCIVIIITATPLLLTIAEWMSHINIEKAKEAQDLNNRMMGAFLSMKSIPQLLTSFFVLAILAGVSEELFFRGLLLRFSAKKISSIALPIVITAFLFASMHTNIYGLPSIFIAGVLLGYFYYLTGSLWCSVIAHVIYNGLQVIAVYLAANNPTIAAINETNHVPVLWVIIGTSISIACFYKLWQTRTPLPQNWTEDYTQEELAALKNDEQQTF
jgi:membrane protease YdiL (CAAX protease family)